MTSTTHNNNQHGFTLVEIILSMGIISAIGLAIIAFQQTVIRNTSVLQSNLIAQQQVRKTLAAFTTELRSAKQSAAGAIWIESAATSSIVFFADVDSTTDTERVRYFLSTSTSPTIFDVLKKGVIKPTGSSYPSANEILTIVAQDMRNSSSTPLFSYYDKNYAGTTSPLTIPINIPAVRHVKMNIVIDPNSARSPIMQNYSTEVTIRNLKDNY